jgi:hypothetical protein
MKIYVIVQNSRTKIEWLPQLVDCSEFGAPLDPKKALLGYLDMLGRGYKIVDVWPTSESREDYIKWLNSQKEKKEDE